MNTLNSYKRQLEENKKNLQSKCLEKESIMKEFETLVPPTHQMRDDLHIIFMQRQDDENANILESDSFDEIFISDIDDEELRPDSCPIRLFTDVISLREKRKLIEHEYKNLESVEAKLQSSYELFHSKLLQSESTLEENRQRIQKFELHKLHQLNNTTVKTALTTKQIFLWEDDQFQTPAVRFDATNFLILPTQHLLKLIQQCWEMCDALRVGRTKLVDLTSEMRKTVKRGRELEGLIQLEKRKCEDLQMLKFGQTFDIDAADKLDGKLFNPVQVIPPKELEICLKQKAAEIRHTEDSIAEVRHKLKDTLNKNTEILNFIAEVSNQKDQICQNKGNKIEYYKTNHGDADNDVLLKLKMKSLKQRKNIGKLKKEIISLKRKDGKSLLNLTKV